MAKGEPRVDRTGSDAPAKRKTATIELDEDDFVEPLAEHMESARLAFRTASATTTGAAKRVQQALDDIADLKTFSDEIDRHLNDATFTQLPRIARPGPVGEIHRLTVGPYAGAFVVSDDEEHVLALFFARSEEFDERIGALLARYARGNDDG